MAGDVVEAVLYREVACGQAMDLGVRKDFQKGFSSCWREEDIALTPEDDRLRLMLFEERLPLRIVLDVRTVVIEEIELNLLAMRALQGQQVIRIPIVRADKLGDRRTCEVHGFHGFQFQKTSDGRLIFCATIQPERVAKSAPGIGKADLVSIRVLNDEPFEKFWPFADDAEADRAAVVLDEKPELVEALGVEKVLDDFGQLVKGVWELRRVRRIAVAKAWVIR